MDKRWRYSPQIHRDPDLQIFSRDDGSISLERDRSISISAVRCDPLITLRWHLSLAAIGG